MERYTVMTQLKNGMKLQDTLYLQRLYPSCTLFFRNPLTDVHEDSLLTLTQAQVYNDNIAQLLNTSSDNNQSNTPTHACEEPTTMETSPASDNSEALTCKKLTPMAASDGHNDRGLKHQAMAETMAEAPSSKRVPSSTLSKVKEKRRHSTDRRDMTKLPHLSTPVQGEDLPPRISPSMIPQLPTIVDHTQQHQHMQTHETKKKVFNLTLEAPIPLFHHAAENPNLDLHYKHSEHLKTKKGKTHRRFSTYPQEKANKSKSYTWQVAPTHGMGSSQPRTRGAPAVNMIDPGAIKNPNQQTTGFKGKRLTSYKNKDANPFSTKDPLPFDALQIGLPTATDNATTNPDPDSAVIQTDSTKHPKPQQYNDVRSAMPSQVNQDTAESMATSTQETEMNDKSRGGEESQQSNTPVLGTAAKRKLLRRNTSMPSLSVSSTTAWENSAWDTSRIDTINRLRHMNRIDKASEDEEVIDEEKQERMDASELEVEGGKIDTTNMKTDEHAKKDNSTLIAGFKRLSSLQRDMTRVTVHSVAMRMTTAKTDTVEEESTAAPDTSYLVTYNPDKKTRHIMNHLRGKWFHQV